MSNAEKQLGSRSHDGIAVTDVHVGSNTALNGIIVTFGLVTRPALPANHNDLFGSFKSQRAMMRTPDEQTTWLRFKPATKAFIVTAVPH